MSPHSGTRAEGTATLWSSVIPAESRIYPLRLTTGARGPGRFVRGGTEQQSRKMKGTLEMQDDAGALGPAQSYLS